MILATASQTATSIVPMAIEPLAVAAGFFLLHHAGEDPARIEIGLRLVEERARIGAEDARMKRARIAAPQA